jgi:hypothetical protein
MAKQVRANGREQEAKKQSRSKPKTRSKLRTGVRSGVDGTGETLGPRNPSH